MMALKSPCDETAIISSPAASSPATNGSWVLAATILGSSMAFIDGTAVNVALPALQSALHASVSDVQWVVESYSLFLSSFLLFGGSLGDIYGRARTFVFGVAIFAAGSVCSGLAPSVSWLIAARSLQGLGAALLVPGSLALVSASFCDSERGRAIGIWSGFTAITTAIGPVLGGWIVEHISWRWIFFINLPMAIAVICITLWRIPESHNDSAARKQDWPGTFLAALGLGAVTFALIEGARDTVLIKLVASLGLCALVAFVVVERHSTWPMVPMALFRSHNFTAANLLTFFLYAALSGILFFFPLDLIQVHGYSATQAGAALLPLIVLMFLLSRWSGGLIVRFGPKGPLTIGPLVAAAGFALFLRADSGGGYWATFFPAVAVLGMGMAISVAPLTTTVMSSVPRSDTGAASGINNAVSRVAGLLAIAVFGLLLQAGFNRSLDRRLDVLGISSAERRQIDQQRSKLAAIETPDPRVDHAIGESFTDGYRIIIWAAVGLALVSALVTVILMGRQVESGNLADNTH